MNKDEIFDIDILSEITGENMDDGFSGSLNFKVVKYDDYISIQRKFISSEPFFSDKKTIFYEEIHRISMNEYKTYLRDKKITNLLRK